MLEDVLPPIVQHVTTFIEKELMRFHVSDANKFASGFSDIATYRRFLDVITARHDDASRCFKHASNALSASAANAPATDGPRDMTDAEIALLAESELWFRMVRLEIESWYLFAKILLDKVARGIEFYFGHVRGLSLDSHDQFVKNFERYAQAKTLSVPMGLMEASRALKQDVADFRDYQIAHQKAPGTMRGVVHGPSAPGVRLTMFAKKQVESLHLSELNERTDAFIKAVIDLLEANSHKTKLLLRKSGLPRDRS